jgi:uncharacterized protein with ACT and thioredoxin-like domain
MDETKKYELEDILAMLGGYEYFDYNQIQYVYHNLNGETEKAAVYLELCNEKTKKLEELKNKLKTEEEIKRMNDMKEQVHKMLSVEEVD